MAATVLTVALVLGAGCAGGNSEPAEQIATAHDELASPLVERVIPLRFIQLQAYANEPDFVSYDAMRQRVQEANWTYKAAGVQFYVDKWDHVVAPTFNAIDLEGIKRAWSEVRPQLQSVFPSLSSNAYPDDALLSETRWLGSAAAKVADRTEIIIWMPKTLPPAPDGFYWCGNPNADGPDCMFAPDITWKATHEFGHVLGLGHTHDDRPNAVSPVTGAFNPRSDSWDLVYVPPNTIFTTRAAAAALENQLQTKNVEPNHINNCNVDATCTVACNISGVNYTTGSPMLKGLAFTFVGDSPGAPHRGFNAMVYFGSDCAINGLNGMGISDAQAMQIRRTLRYDIFIDNPGILVPGALGLTSGRPYLRDWRGRSTVNGLFAEKLDLDGDNKRDIGVWQPPTSPTSLGTFTFLLSGTGYSANQALTRSFGQMEDIPVMADYDGDNKTDIAVYHSGGPTGSDPTNAYAYWKICKSSANFDCVNASSIQWGNRMDVPLPGSNFDGDGVSDLAVYRPNSGEWYWRTVASSTPHTIYGDGSLPTTPRVQLPGLYDNDEKTDIVYYDPASATFSMLLSGNGWAQASRIDRSFPVTSIPLYAVYDSGGAVVSPRAQTTRWICSGGFCFPRARRVLQLWEEWTGNWHTMWDPVNSPALTTCQWGTGLDVPLSGNIDRDGDGMSDFAVWRLSNADSGGVFWFKDSAGGSCSGGTFGVTAGTPSPRTQVFSVWDMSGDQKDEMMILYPDTLWWWRLDSTGYTSGSAIQLGASGAVGL